MFRFLILLAGVLLSSADLFAQQNKRANIWYFGNNAGVDFSGGSPRSVSGSEMQQWEGCSSICDEEGKLLLYSNGIQIWNRNNQVISGDEPLGGNDTATQSVIILPKPGSKTIYYVFTTNTKLSCIIVDVTLNSGNGGIISRQILLESSTEKLTATAHCNQKDIWILSHEGGNNSFKCFLLTEKGLKKSTVDSRVGTAFDARRSLGHMKFSPKGDRLALAYFEKSIVELFKFDNQTGKVFSPTRLLDPDFSRGYGLEFSPNGKYLYVGKTLFPTAPIYQLNLSGSSSQEILRSKRVVGKIPSEYFGALQLGPDQKIYIARNGSNYLSIIHNPDHEGNGCAFEVDGLRINSGTVGIGLPNFPGSFLQELTTVRVASAGTCNDIILTAETTPVNDVFVYQWYKDGDPLRHATGKTYIPGSSGVYTVGVSRDCSDEMVISKPFQVHVLESNPKWIKLDCGSIMLEANANSNVKWSGTNITALNENEPLVNLVGSGQETYQLMVYDINNSCSMEKEVFVDFGKCDATVLIPDIFTPNGDQINDVFEVIISDGEGVQLKIYDRWGEVIYLAEKEGIRWDGKINGSDAMTGAYTYTLHYKNANGHDFTRRGAIILQR